MWMVFFKVEGVDDPNKTSYSESDEVPAGEVSRTRFQIRHEEIGHSEEEDVCDD